jgi:putative FmdB family regulatory protein
MPIYEYQCEKCGHQLEKLQKMSDDPLKDCPECEEPALRKLVSAAAFKLKGTGWYETDFKDNSNKKPDTQTTDKKESDKKVTPAKETKPEKKAKPVSKD